MFLNTCLFLIKTLHFYNSNLKITQFYILEPKNCFVSCCSDEEDEEENKNSNIRNKASIPILNDEIQLKKELESDFQTLQISDTYLQKEINELKENINKYLSENIKDENILSEIKSELENGIYSKTINATTKIAFWSGRKVLYNGFKIFVKNFLAKEVAKFAAKRAGAYAGKKVVQSAFKSFIPVIGPVLTILDIADTVWTGYSIYNELTQMDSDKICKDIEDNIEKKIENIFKDINNKLEKDRKNIEKKIDDYNRELEKEILEYIDKIKIMLKFLDSFNWIRLQSHENEAKQILEDILSENISIENLNLLDEMNSEDLFSFLVDIYVDKNCKITTYTNNLISNTDLHDIFFFHSKMCLGVLNSISIIRNDISDIFNNFDEKIKNLELRLEDFGDKDKHFPEFFKLKSSINSKKEKLYGTLLLLENFRTHIDNKILFFKRSTKFDISDNPTKEFIGKLYEVINPVFLDIFKVCAGEIKEFPFHEYNSIISIKSRKILEHLLSLLKDKIANNINPDNKKIIMQSSSRIDVDSDDDSSTGYTPFPNPEALNFINRINPSLNTSVSNPTIENQSKSITTPEVSKICSIYQEYFRQKPKDWFLKQVEEIIENNEKKGIDKKYSHFYFKITLTVGKILMVSRNRSSIREYDLMRILKGVYGFILNVNENVSNQEDITILAFIEFIQMLISDSSDLPYNKASLSFLKIILKKVIEYLNTLTNDDIIFTDFIGEICHFLKHCLMDYKLLSLDQYKKSAQRFLDRHLHDLGNTNNRENLSNNNNEDIMNGWEITDTSDKNILQEFEQENEEVSFIKDPLFMFLLKEKDINKLKSIKFKQEPEFKPTKQRKVTFKKNFNHKTQEKILIYEVEETFDENGMLREKYKIKTYFLKDECKKYTEYKVGMDRDNMFTVNPLLSILYHEL